jgi:hemerythrin-like domain-containing protein
MTEILRKLRAQHDELAKVLDVLEQEVETCRKHGRINRDILGGVLDYCRGYLTPCHHAKEDLIYRELRLAAEPAAINSIGDLVAEHEALVELTNELEAAVDNLLSDTRKRHEKFVRVAQAFLEQNRQHIRAEEDEFFHVAMECLSDENWAKIDREVIALEASQPTVSINERFASFAREIVESERLEHESR